ncbi:MAG: NAD-dependent epimerase/dehydratase family protein, partial [Flavobacteriales bacterium]
SGGSIKYFETDLLEKGAYAEAMKNCELVYHTASPFITVVENAQRDLLDPAEKGTENVLRSANDTPSVKRVVVTSSCAAMYSDALDCLNAPEGQLTEAVWNETASAEYQPYSYSKTIAEKKAWEVNKEQNQWDLVTINPSLVMGPALNVKASKSESINILKQLGDGTMKMGVPKMGVGMVDVRDVAEAHYQAGFMPKAKGRYITSAHNTDFLEMGLSLQPKFGGKYPLPKKAMPKWLLMMVGPMVNKVLTKKFIRNNVNIEWKADNSKIKKELGVNFRPLQETMEDSFQMMVDEKLV